MPAADKTDSNLTAADVTTQAPRACSTSSSVPSPGVPADRGRVTLWIPTNPPPKSVTVRKFGVKRSAARPLR